MDPIGEEDVNEPAFGVDPDHGAGETGMAVAALGCLEAGGAGCAADERFVEAEAAAAA